jgi:hypothetical protein
MVLAGCASTKVIAPEKEYTPPGETTAWKLGGVFDTRAKSVAISINGDNVINSAFAPFTPRLTAQGKYSGKVVQAHCAFASGVLGTGGLRSKIAGSIVSRATNTGGNTCDVTIAGQAATTLYF